MVFASFLHLMFIIKKQIYQSQLLFHGHNSCPNLTARIGLMHLAMNTYLQVHCAFCTNMYLLTDVRSESQQFVHCAGTLHVIITWTYFRDLILLLASCTIYVILTFIKRKRRYLAKFRGITEALPQKIVIFARVNK